MRKHKLDFNRFVVTANSNAVQYPVSCGKVKDLEVQFPSGFSITAVSIKDEFGSDTEFVDLEIASGYAKLSTKAISSITFMLRRSNLNQELFTKCVKSIKQKATLKLNAPSLDCHLVFELQKPSNINLQGIELVLLRDGNVVDVDPEIYIAADHIESLFIEYRNIVGGQFELQIVQPKADRHFTMWLDDSKGVSVQHLTLEALRAGFKLKRLNKCEDIFGLHDYVFDFSKRVMLGVGSDE
jgi:hypothetical protein